MVPTALFTVQRTKEFYTSHRRRNGLFSEKAVNIIDAYRSILGAEYFNPLTFCMLPPPLPPFVLVQTVLPSLQTKVSLGLASFTVSPAQPLL